MPSYSGVPGPPVRISCYRKLGHGAHCIMGENEPLSSINGVFFKFYLCRSARSNDVSSETLFIVFIAISPQFKCK